MTLAGRWTVLGAMASVLILGGCSIRSEPMGSSIRDGTGGVATQCRFTHREAIDPIRFPDGDGKSHLHDFFGATAVRSSMSAEFLLAQENTCNASGDRSSYWVPTLIDEGRAVAPTSLAVYLTTPEGVDPDEVVSPPNGLQMVTYVSSWSCTRQGEVTASPRECPRNAGTRLRLEFPHCWNGKDLAPSTGVDHVAVTDSVCPVSHPVVLPRIVMELRYQVSSVRAITFSSGDVATVHGDLFFAWDREALDRDFDACLRRNIMCGVTWSTELGA